MVLPLQPFLYGFKPKLFKLNCTHKNKPFIYEARV